MNSTSQNTKMDIFLPHFGFKTKRVVAAHMLTSHTTKPNVVFLLCVCCRSTTYCSRY